MLKSDPVFAPDVIISTLAICLRIELHVHRIRGRKTHISVDALL